MGWSGLGLSPSGHEQHRYEDANPIRICYVLGFGASSSGQLNRLVAGVAATKNHSYKEQLQRTIFDEICPSSIGCYWLQKSSGGRNGTENQRPDSDRPRTLQAVQRKDSYAASELVRPEKAT